MTLMRNVDLTDCTLLRNMQVLERPCARILSVGGCLPERIVSNHQLAEMLDAPAALKRKIPAIIREIAGIETRRVAPTGTDPSTLAVHASREALASAGMTVADIDTLIFAGTDLDMGEPATANILQKKLGAKLVNAFDVKNACNSFIQAMNMANSLLATGASRHVLIATGEIGTHVMNRTIADATDLRAKLGGLTLGDGGAAMVMAGSDGGAGILEINLVSMGEYWELCHVPATRDGMRREAGTVHDWWFYLDMPGLAKLVRPLTRTYHDEYARYRRRAFGEARYIDHVAKIVPHQISTVLIEELIVAISGRRDRFCISADCWGNTASASIPLTFQREIERGALALGSGQEVMFFGAASGFSVGHLRIRL